MKIAKSGEMGCETLEVFGLFDWIKISGETWWNKSKKKSTAFSEIGTGVFAFIQHPIMQMWDRVVKGKNWILSWLVAG